MKVKLLIILLVFLVIILFLNYRNYLPNITTNSLDTVDAEPGQKNTLFWVNVNGERYVPFKTYSKMLPNNIDILGFVKEYNTSALKHEQTNNEIFVGQPYTIYNETLLVYCETCVYYDADMKAYYDSGWLECYKYESGN